MISLLYSNPLLFLVLVPVVIISLVLHELAHGYVALWNGDPTAKYHGRLSLNPASHFDMMGFLMLTFVGFGYAKPVPVNKFNFRNQRRGVFTVAIAGVTVNLILAFVASFFVALLDHLNLSGMSDQLYILLYSFFYFMMIINLNLMFFNLLPVFPLDGFRVVEAFTRPTNPYTKFMRDFGQYILLGLIALSMMVSRTGMPHYFDLLYLYINNCNQFVTFIFNSLWGLIFGA